MNEQFVLHNYDTVLNEIHKSKEKRIAAVTAAADQMVLESVVKAKKEQIADAILVGEKAKIADILQNMGENPADYMIENTADNPAVMADTAVELVKRHDANFLMKGLIETSDFLRPVVKKENGLRTGRVMSHLAFNSLPNYKKLIVNTDGGINPYPDLEKKKQILANVFEILQILGYECPKAACLCCKETVDQKMPETLDARALQEAAENGFFGNCIVIGPISYDIAMSPEIAKEKRFDCKYAGDFDVVLQPNIHCGNILGKSWLVTSHATLAGVVAGAKVPIVLTSRGSSADEKLLSIALAGLIASRKQKSC